MADFNTAAARPPVGLAGKGRKAEPRDAGKRKAQGEASQRISKKRDADTPGSAVEEGLEQELETFSTRGKSVYCKEFGLVAPHRPQECAVTAQAPTQAESGSGSPPQQPLAQPHKDPPVQNTGLQAAPHQMMGGQPLAPFEGGGGGWLPQMQDSSVLTQTVANSSPTWEEDLLMRAMQLSNFSVFDVAAYTWQKMKRMVQDKQAARRRKDEQQQLAVAALYGQVAAAVMYNQAAVHALHGQSAGTARISR